MEVQLDPKIFQQFYSKFAMSMRLPTTSSKVIAEFVDIDVNTDVICKILSRNQYFEYMLMEQIKSLGLKENIPSLKAAIVLLGMQAVRDFICALQLHRIVTKKHLKLDKESKTVFKASDTLKYALKSEEYIVMRKFQYSDAAYAAGLMYDIILLIAREHYGAPKSFEDYIEEVYKHGLRSARIALDLVKQFKSTGYSKYVFAAGLVHDIGKLVMELLYPPGSSGSFQKFREDIAKKPMTREVVHFLEAKRFGLTHEYYGAQLCYNFELFRVFERAILFHHDPYLIKNQNKDLYSLAATIALASNMATHFRVPKDTKDPIFNSWLSFELKDLKISPNTLLGVVKNIPRDLF